MRRPVVWSALAVATLILLVPHVAAAAGCDSPFSEYQQRGFLWMYLASFGFGFQTSLTPCVYPLIPITLGIFGARGKHVSRGRALALATSYVVGMGVTYATLGVIIAMVGGQFGSLLANPFVVVPIVLMLAALAASMFGAFELNLPASWQARLSQVGGAGFRGAFAMGMVGGLVAAPCTGPFLLGLLTFVATTHSVVYGGSLLFVYALGMGVLFWVIAAFSMSLPKSGKWMEWVKSGGGILLLVGGLYFLRPLVPAMRHAALPDTWFLLASISVLVAGLFLGAIHLSFHGGTAEKVRKALGILFVLLGIFGAWNWKLAPKHHVEWIRGDEKLAFDTALAQHKAVMVDFSADWCGPCEELETTFGDDDVYEAITKNFIPLKFDVSEGNKRDLALKDHYDAGTLPAVVYITTDGIVVGRVRKMIEADEMMPILNHAVAASKDTSLVASKPCN